MLLIPAIDLKGGQCVRLRQGRMDDVTVFSDDPVTVAKRWADEGAERVHIVDLDGAIKGQPVNLKVVEQIAEAISIPVQIGGGVRDEDTDDAAPGTDHLAANHTWTFTVAITDGLAATAEQTFVLTIRPVPAPVPVNGALALALIAPGAAVSMSGSRRIQRAARGERQRDRRRRVLEPGRRDPSVW